MDANVVNRLSIQRTAYVIAAIATLVGCGGGIVGFGGLVRKLGASPEVSALAVLPFALAIAFVLGVAGLFIFLALRPRPWGKLVCVVGLPWISFSAVSLVLTHIATGFQFSPLLLLPGIGGLTLLVVGFVLLILDGGRLLDRPGQRSPASQ